MFSTRPSIGIEFEYDCIEKGASSAHYTKRQLLPNEEVDTQDDCTVATEIRLGPYTSIRKFAEDWQRILTKINVRYNNAVPCTKGSASNESIGQHHHLGVLYLDPDVTFSDWKDMRQKIGRNIRKMLPFFEALYTNDPQSDYKSYRMAAKTQYCTPIRDGAAISFNNRYAEVNGRDDHGTVEVRVYDSHLPQVALTVARMEMAIIKATCEKGVMPQKPYVDYSIERKKATEQGVIAIDAQNYWNWFMKHFGKEYIQLAKEDGGFLDCELEILFNALNHRMSPTDLSRISGIRSISSEFNFFKKAFSDITKFVDHLAAFGLPAQYKGKINVNLRKFTRRQYLEQLAYIFKSLRSGMDYHKVVEEYEKLYNLKHSTAWQRVHSFMQAIREGGKTKEEFSQWLSARPYIVKADNVNQLVDMAFSDNPVITPNPEVQIFETPEAPEGIAPISGTNITIDRIRDESNAVTIAVALNLFGSQSNRNISQDWVQNSQKRFYIARDNTGAFVGCVAVRRRTGLISHLVILPGFRRHGYARLLIRNILPVLRGTAHAWVNVDNTASINLFNSLGFCRVDGRTNGNGQTMFKMEIG